MTKKFIFVLTAILILLITPISAENVTIDNSTLIQDTVNIASDNDIIYLNPGTYHESAIKSAKTLHCKALGTLKTL